MATIEVKDVAAKLKSIATYGNNLAQVFHNHALIAFKIPIRFEGSINIIDATVTTLNQLAGILVDEVTEKSVVNDDGLKYVELLGAECATEVARIELAVVKASVLNLQGHKAGRRRYSRHLLKPSDYVTTAQTEIATKKLPDDFLVAVEHARWDRIENDLDDCIERLYELQLHLMLVFLVVTVGSLSKDVSSGKANVSTVVTFHDRICRTAGLVGLKRQRGSSSASGSESSGSGSDSDTSCRIRRRPYTPPPPLPLGFGAPRPTPRGLLPGSPIPPHGNMPPSYVESYKPELNSESPDLAPDIHIYRGPPNTVPTSLNATPSYPQEKLSDAEVAEPKEETKTPKSTVPDGRLLKTKSTGFGLKLRNLFRTKASLAEEMQRILSDAESTLTAFIIQNSELRQVPHSAFHSLEVTHMRTLLSQINDDTWYKTFSDLRDDEHDTLDRITTHRYCGETFNRDVVALKVLHKNSFNAWMRLLTEKIQEDWIHPHHENNRVILAIVREKLNDKLPAPSPQKYRGMGPRPGCYMGPPGPPPGPPPPPPPPPPHAMLPPMPPKIAPSAPSIRPPPLPSYRRPNGISDLRDGPAPHHPPPTYPVRGFPVLPGSFGPSDEELSVMADHDVHMALTTYNEYTFRPAVQSLDGSIPGNWNRVTITQESNDRDVVLQKVKEFKSRGLTMIAAKLRISQPQDGQVSRLMEELKNGERDGRFEWNWVELSLHTDTLEAPHVAGSAQCVTRMHAIAQRSPRPEYKPKELYKVLFDNPRPCYMPPGIPGPPPPPPPSGPPNIVITPRRYSSSDESDSSVGIVRRRLKSRRKNKIRRQARYNDSDSSDSENEERMQKDVRIKIILKPGDNVAEKLLDLWTVN